jgi:hypothetical protein
MPDSKPCEFEIDVLRMIAGRPNGIKHWGAAVGQAIEVCTGSGWATLAPGGLLEITPRGIAVLDAAERGDPA